jgi:hypothetical protein
VAKNEKITTPISELHLTQLLNGERDEERRNRLWLLLQW